MPFSTSDLPAMDVIGWDASSTGPVPTVIEAYGLTSLVEIANNFYLDRISSGSGPR